MRVKQGFWGVAIVIQLSFFLSCAETGGKNYHFVHETADIGENDHYYVQTFSKMFMVYVSNCSFIGVFCAF